MRMRGTDHDKTMPSLFLCWWVAQHCHTIFSQQYIKGSMLHDEPLKWVPKKANVCLQTRMVAVIV